MTNAPATPNKTIAKGIAALPLKILMLLVKHPFLVVVMALLLMWGTISGLALFNTAISERFNSAVAYFGLATVASEASDIWRRNYNAEVDKNRRSAESLAMKEAEMERSRARIDETNRNNTKLELDVKEKNRQLKSKNAKIDQLNSAIKKKNAVLRRSAKELRHGADVLKVTSKELRSTAHSLGDITSKLSRFGHAGKQIESGVAKRFTKVAIFDAAGEFLGWIPIIGDAASLGLAATGIYEMCQMFKEIEQATTDLGVPYQVYTDTFCEKPVEKSADIISETTKSAKDTLGDRMNYTKIYWTNKYNEHF
jgi:hypothetical protein